MHHVASAYFPPPYQDSAILSMDGVGEWNTVALAHGYKNRITNLRNLNFPHSIGLCILLLHTIVVLRLILVNIN